MNITIGQLKYHCNLKSVDIPWSKFSSKLVKLTNQGRFPFSQKFRKFRFVAKWKTFFRFARLENSQKKWNCSKGSPVFPVGTSQWKFVFHLQNFSSLYQFHAFRGPFKWPGFPGPRFQKWRLIQVRFLEAFCKQTSGLLRVLCLLRSSVRAWKFIAARMCLV